MISRKKLFRWIGTSLLGAATLAAMTFAGLVNGIEGVLVTFVIAAGLGGIVLLIAASEMGES